MSAPAEEAPWKAGLRAARANFAPGLVLQLLALALVLAYYQIPAVRQAFDHLAAFRTRTGFLYSIVATGACGGLFPLLYLKAFPATRARYTWTQGAAITAIWAYKGVEVDLWYVLLARFVGEGNTPGTVLAKMALDQFVYCPLWAVPVMWVYYAWTELRFRARPLVEDMRRPGWYRRRVVPMLLSNLGVWIPAVCIIYSLPTPLQIPLFNLVLCFYTLLLSHLSRRAA